MKRPSELQIYQATGLVLAILIATALRQVQRHPSVANTAPATAAPAHPLTHDSTAQSERRLGEITVRVTRCYTDLPAVACRGTAGTSSDLIRKAWERAGYTVVRVNPATTVPAGATLADSLASLPSLTLRATPPCPTDRHA